MILFEAKIDRKRAVKKIMEKAFYHVFLFTLKFYADEFEGIS